MTRPPKTAVACINCRHYDHVRIRFESGRVRHNGTAPCRWPKPELIMPNAYWRTLQSFKFDNGGHMEPYPIHDCKTFELIASDAK